MRGGRTSPHTPVIARDTFFSMHCCEASGRLCRFSKTGYFGKVSISEKPRCSTSDVASLCVSRISGGSGAGTRTMHGETGLSRVLLSERREI